MIWAWFLSFATFWVLLGQCNVSQGMSKLIALINWAPATRHGGDTWWWHPQKICRHVSPKLRVSPTDLTTDDSFPTLRLWFRFNSTSEAGAHLHSSKFWRQDGTGEIHALGWMWLKISISSKKIILPTKKGNCGKKAQFLPLRVCVCIWLARDSPND